LDAARLRGDAVDRELRGVGDDGGAEARAELLQHGVAADVAHPARFGRSPIFGSGWKRN
jgi:hypothetical protein